MAKVLDATEVDFSRRHADRWFQSDWLNGEPWLLESGADFQAKGETIRTRLYSEAAAQGMSARVKILGNGDVIFQAYQPTPEEMERKRQASEKRSATRAANAANGTGKRAKKTA